MKVNSFIRVFLTTIFTDEFNRNVVSISARIHLIALPQYLIVSDSVMKRALY